MVKFKNKTEKTNKHKLSPLPVIISLLTLLLLAFGISKITQISPKLGYPRSYEHEVLAASREYELDPDLVFAVIRTESHFEKDAVSHAGAKGLMQIMPATGEWIAMRKGFTYDSEKIFEPAYNIELGCYLLSYLLDYYKNDLTLAVAAYNAGNGNVDKWLKNPDHYDGKTLNIPFNETRNYVKKVLDSYEKYKKQRG